MKKKEKRVTPPSRKRFYFLIIFLLLFLVLFILIFFLFQRQYKEKEENVNKTTRKSIVRIVTETRKNDDKSNLITNIFIGLFVTLIVLISVFLAFIFILRSKSLETRIVTTTGDEESQIVNKRDDKELQIVTTQKTVNTPDDGNCLFYSLAYIINDHKENPIHSSITEEKLGNQARELRNKFAEYIVNDKDKYDLYIANATGTAGYEKIDEIMNNKKIKDKDKKEEIKEELKKFENNPIQGDNFVLDWFANTYKYNLIVHDNVRKMKHKFGEQNSKAAHISYGGYGDHGHYEAIEKT